MSFEPLKNSLNKQFYQSFFQVWKSYDPNFNIEKMESSIFNKSWDQLELKERTRSLTLNIHKQLPADFKKASDLLIKILNKLAQLNHKVERYEYFFLPDYIEVFGQNHVDISLDAIEQITKHISCEFAIRPFIIQDRKKVMGRMTKWSTHPHENIRRFASEGCRPKLPWGMALKELIEDPSEILPILENLKSDDSLFVRKSVANNLNDISKDHPELVLKIAKKWQNFSDNTNWIIKHACRTLLKKGNQQAMELFGYSNNNALEISSINLASKEIKMGDHLSFKFTLKNLSKANILVRLEYGCYFLKSNGKQNRKVFKISEKALKPLEKITIQKNHSIIPISTRKYYAGEQALSLIVNGKEIEKLKYLLQIPN
ncbi:MAG: DNA alkylation repair protein [Flavobacteriales bacterium]|nr:DNA alkylation repair protein [Flavobacteriales bacterium]